MDSIERKNLNTEKQNINSQALDSKSISEILHIINAEDQKLSDKVKEAIPEIEQTVLITKNAIRNGHRIYYVGAGTSGRLGVLDASEIPPTFSAPNYFFNGIIAGGDKALRQSIEGIEDQPEKAINDLKSVDLKANDVVIGIPIGISSFCYLLICTVTAYLRNITLTPNFINDWLSLLFTILLINSIQVISLDLIFSLEVNYMKYFINLGFTFILYPLFLLIFNSIEKRIKFQKND